MRPALFGAVLVRPTGPRPSRQLDQPMDPATGQPEINTNAGFSMLQRTIGHADDIRHRPRHRHAANPTERAIEDYFRSRKTLKQTRTATGDHLAGDAPGVCRLSDGHRADQPRSAGRSHRSSAEEMAYRWLNIACFFMTGMALMTLAVISVEAVAQL